MVNSSIEKHNKEKNYSLNLGTFPLKYFQDKYQDAQALRKTFKETSDLERKKELGANFKKIYDATQEFCNERHLPKTWAWEYADINEEPA